MYPGELSSCNIQVKDPQGHPEDINLNIKLIGKPKNTVKLINGSAYISTDIKLSVRVLSVDDECDYSKSEIVEALQEEINSYFKQIILDYLYKTSKEYNSDIDGFGKYAIKYFFTTQEWQDFNWLDNYENSFFQVNVDSKVKSGYSFISI